jgi:hypothetical protein
VSRTKLPGHSAPSRIFMGRTINVLRVAGDDVDATVGDYGRWRVTRRGEVWRCTCPLEERPCVHIVCVEKVVLWPGQAPRRGRRLLSRRGR